MGVVYRARHVLIDHVVALKLIRPDLRGETHLRARMLREARGEDAGPQSDLYALGILFFEMLTGQLPFRSSDRETMLEMQRSSPSPKPRALKRTARAAHARARP